jgi:microcystin-dependent protein
MAFGLATKGDLARFIERVVEGMPRRRTAEPVGVMHPYAGPAAPAGYLLCNGAPVSRTAYKDLFNAIGTTWGAGDGSTTFNLPNGQRRTFVGADGGAGRQVGNSGGAEAANMPSHSHGGVTGGMTASNPHSHPGDGGYGFAMSNGAVAGKLGADMYVVSITHAQTGQTNIEHGHAIAAEGAGGAEGNMPPFLVGNWIIRAR